MPYHLLNLFSGTGGAAWGYHQSGFEVQAVDPDWRAQVPVKTLTASDWRVQLEVDQAYDAIHLDLSHPCAPRDFGVVREALNYTGKPWVMESSTRTGLNHPILLCGQLFPGCEFVRHRWFECSEFIWVPHHGADGHQQHRERLWLSPHCLSGTPPPAAKPTRKKKEKNGQLAIPEAE